MSRLVPAECIMRPSQIRDLRQLAGLDRRLTAELNSDNHPDRWRNFAALAFLTFSIVVALKDLKLLGLILLGFAPIYCIFGWLHYLTQHPPNQEWGNYWVVECNDRLIACAKWQHYASYSELQQLYVVPKWRFHGLGSSLTDRLISQTDQPIYILSDRKSDRFFTRFGFVAIDWDDLPPNFPVPEFTVPGLERSRQDLIPMVRRTQPIDPPRLTAAQSLQTLPAWQGIPVKLDDRPDPT
jgi:GNAT superfamily N-acetyltransferase